MLPPAWGYTDQPLLTPLLARATVLLADEPWALRLPAMVFAVLSVVVVVAYLTREVGRPGWPRPWRPGATRTEPHAELRAHADDGLGRSGRVAAGPASGHPCSAPAAGPLVVAGRPGRWPEYLQQVADRPAGRVRDRRAAAQRPTEGAGQPSLPGLGRARGPARPAQPGLAGRPRMAPARHGSGPRGPQRGGRSAPRGADPARDDRSGAVPGLRGRRDRPAPTARLAPGALARAGDGDHGCPDPGRRVPGSLPLRPGVGDLRRRLRTGCRVRPAWPGAAETGRRRDGGACGAGRGGEPAGATRAGAGGDLRANPEHGVGRADRLGRLRPADRRGDRGGPGHRPRRGGADQQLRRGRRAGPLHGPSRCPGGQWPQRPRLPRQPAARHPDGGRRGGPVASDGG